ncbi:MAG: ATP-binding protein [Pirellulaceae bacterium]
MTRLLVIHGNDRGKQYELDDDITSIGREPHNAIQLNDPEVSRVHALIKNTDAGFVIGDRTSSNGTFVNKRKIKKHLLTSRDLIRVGQTTLVFDSSPVVSMVDIKSMVNIATGDSEDSGSGSHIVKTISAKVALPSYEEDSQITDSFLEHLEENIHVIYHTAVATSRITNIDELHQKVLQLIFDWVSADRGCVLLLDEDSNKITPVAFRHNEETDEDAKPIEIDQSILQYAREKNEGVLSSDIEHDDRWSMKPPPEARKHGFVEAMCVPMIGRMGTVGFVYVDNFVPPPTKRSRKDGKDDNFAHQFSVQHLKLLLAVAHQAALATENANYYALMSQNAQLAAVGETFTQIAHHLRNMLQGLDDTKRRVRQGIERQDWTRVLEGWREIDPLTTRIYNLSLNLLSFSRPREPQLVMDSINDAVQDVITTVEPMSKARGIKLDWEPNFDIRPLFFDPEALYRAALNVVQNAVDACELGCVIKIRLTEGDEHIHISIIDDGEGIDPRKINLIFKPFASTKGELGTGIGLPVTRQVMREHGGEVYVSSTLGHGSKFTLSLPVRRDKASLPERAADTSMQKARG